MLGPGPCRVLYLFAGPQSRAAWEPALLAAAPGSARLDYRESNLLPEGGSEGFLDVDRQESLLQELREGRVQLLILAPPSRTFSRLCWANNRGPRPVRVSTGFPLAPGEGSQALRP